MQSFTGRRFVPVRVDEVSPGNSYYPILLSLTDEKGKPFRLYMTSDSESRMPRRFDSRRMSPGHRRSGLRRPPSGLQLPH